MPDDTAAPDRPIEPGGMLDGPAAMDSFYWLTGGATPLVPSSRSEDQPREAAREAARTGDALLANGHVRAALERYREAVRLEPANYEHHFKLAQAADPASEAALAEPHFLETVRLNPRHVPSHVALGNIYRQSGRIEQALQHTAAALALDPQDSQAVLARALTLSAAGKPAEAWGLIEPLIAEGSTDPWIARLYARLA